MQVLFYIAAAIAVFVIWLVIIRYVVIGRIPKLLATKNWWFTPNPPEGEIVVIESGGDGQGRDGKAVLYFANIRNHVIGQSGLITENQETHEALQRGPAAWLNRAAGVIFIGGTPGVYKVRGNRLNYLEYSFDVSTNSHRFTPHQEEKRPSIPWRMEIGIICSDLPTLGKEPVELRLGVTFVIEDAYKVLYLTDPDHIAVITLAVTAFVRDYVSKKSIDALMSESHESKADGFVQQIMHIVNTDDGANKGIVSLYGMRIIAIRFAGVRPYGRNADEIANAQAAADLARLEGEGRIAKANANVHVAEAEAEITKLKGLANAAVEAALVEARNGVTLGAAQLAFAEAVAQYNAPGTLVIGGSNPLLSLPTNHLNPPARNIGGTQ
jgi:regulator of protease activity HflC (stomatin/prohibitin superfamily)